MPAAGVACIAAVAAFGELSLGALIAVVATGSLLAAVALARRTGAAAPPVGRRGVPWLVWVIAAGGWELLTFGHGDLPTLSDLLDPVLEHPATRGAATAIWLAGGVWLLTRPTDSELAA